MLIRYSDGRVEPATLLGASRNRMRVARLAGHGSTTFTRLGGQWLSATDGPVDVDFTAATTEREWQRFCERLAGLDEFAPWDAESLAAACMPFPPGKRGIGMRSRNAVKPFAMELYDRFSRGETIAQLAAALEIPAAHVAMRIRAAEQHIRRHGDRGVARIHRQQLRHDRPAPVEFRRAAAITR